jgi:ABC-2 type transport system permease protein
MSPSPGLALLLSLRLRLVRNRLRTLGLGGWLKVAAVAALTLGFMAAEGALAWVLFDAVARHQDLSPLIAGAIIQRLLALVFLVSLSMLFFSNVTASLATIYLSRDLDLLLATPVKAARVFLLKLLETVLNSSYMVVLFVLPILVAFGLALGAPWAYYLQVPLVLGLFVLPPAGAGILVTMLLMRYLPARRTHQALSALGLLLAVSFVTALRLLAPERLLRQVSTDDLQVFLRSLTVPASRFLPSTWAADLELHAARGDLAGAVEHGLPLLALAAAALAVSYALAQRIYRRGVASSHESGRRRRRRRPPLGAPLGNPGKELRLFFRDPTQWSQMLLLLALVVIYVFNITALPNELIVVGGVGRPFITVRDVIAWINVGMAGFVLAAIGMRFVLPSVSTEGGAFWIVASAPVRRRRWLAGKLALYLPPLLLFALVLAELSARALNVDPYTRTLSLATTAAVTVTLTVLAVGLGAALPSFKLENPAQFVLTGGGVLYGVLALMYVVAVVALEARPFFWHLLEQMQFLEPGERQRWPYYLAIAALSAVIAGGSLGWGMRRLERLEL